MRPRTRFASLLLTAIVAVTASASARADVTRYKVDRLRYENKGAYVVQNVIMKFAHGESGGKERICQRYFNRITTITTGEAITYVMPDGGNNWKASEDNPSDCPAKPSEGDEVWMRVEIKNGEAKGCRSDGVKFYYYEDGGTAKYVTKGTTFQDNRCKIVDTPSADNQLP